MQNKESVTLEILVTITFQNSDTSFSTMLVPVTEYSHSIFFLSFSDHFLNIVKFLGKTSFPKVMRHLNAFNFHLPAAVSPWH